jgi:hypothetical protein
VLSLNEDVFPKTAIFSGALSEIWSRLEDLLVAAQTSVILVTLSEVPQEA